MDEDLEYNFTEGSSVIGGDTNRSDPDVGNVSILKQVLKELQVIKDQHTTIDKLNLNDKHFTVEQQLEINQRFVTLLTTVELIISEKLKELK